jgi:hypothetical protein
MHTASEAVVALTGRIDDEARGLLIVKRTGRLEAASGSFELDVGAHDIDNVKACFESINGVLRNHVDILA